MITVSQSEIAAWTRCPRQWLNKYYYGVVPSAEPVTGNMQLGARIATALEGYYSPAYRLDPVAVLEVIYAALLDQHPDWRADIAAERELAVAMMTGYLEWLEAEGADNGLTVVAAETDLQVPLPGVPGVMLRARMDRVELNEADGTLSFVDDKTAANFEQRETLALNPQFKFYSLMQQLAVAGNPGAPHVMGGKVNILRRCKRTSRSQPPYYHREPFRYNPEEIESTRLKVTQVALEIQYARWELDRVYEETGGDLAAVNRVQRFSLRPVEIPSDCKWSCPFARGLCTAMNDGSDWPGMITDSGAWQQADPYGYYAERSDPLRAIRDGLAKV